MFDVYRHQYLVEAVVADRRRRFELDARNSRLARLARRVQPKQQTPEAEVRASASDQRDAA